MHPTVRELLIGLGRLGARATAAAVDVALEGAQEVVGDLQDRLSKGRSSAQKIGKKPRGRVQVNVRATRDEGATNVDAELVDDEGDD